MINQLPLHHNYIRTQKKIQQKSPQEASTPSTHPKPTKKTPHDSFHLKKGKQQQQWEKQTPLGISKWEQNEKKERDTVLQLQDAEE